MGPSIEWSRRSSKDSEERAMTVTTEKLEASKKLARDYIDQVFNQHNPAKAADFVTGDVVWHGGALGDITGPENLAGLLGSFIGALPDLYAAEQDIIAENDLVVVRHRGHSCGGQAGLAEPGFDLVLARGWRCRPAEIRRILRPSVVPALPVRANYGGTMDDPEVVAAIAAGELDGLAAALDKYAASLYEYCYSMAPEIAADAVQDTFVIAWSNLGGLRDPGKLHSWLQAVASNECFRRTLDSNVTDVHAAHAGFPPQVTSSPKTTLP